MRRTLFAILILTLTSSVFAQSDDLIDCDDPDFVDEFGECDDYIDCDDPDFEDEFGECDDFIDCDDPDF
ncbi:MAG: hypothetical protein HN404_13605, partial [Gemmatimonadetes bacterium]|nr:hypothetical protein [Gemmatimonadota bacterium]